MPISDIADEYFTYQSRLASFQTAQQLSKRRASNASSKAPKSLKWPHKFLAPEELAKAGFFFYPTQANPDNVACFLCHKSVDEWAKDDDPLVEHLKLSPDCGWAVVATIETEDGELNQEWPLSARMIEARKATFADKWPHESLKGWKCKTKQMVDAGWKYTPTPEYDDMATCTYCALALDGWDRTDKPMDEHYKRNPDCQFFTLINNHQPSLAVKRTKSKKDRTSKASRLSTQSTFTIASDAPSFADLPAEEGDSILTTATNATSTQASKKMGKGKKAAAGKGRKTKAKKSEAIEIPVVPEPEDDDFEVKVEVAPKATRGQKRKSEDAGSRAHITEIHPPPAKRRTTRMRASTVMDDVVINPVEAVNPADIEDAPKAAGRKKGRTSTARSTRKASATPMATLPVPVPNDEEIDAALEADLERPLTDDEDTHPPPTKKGRSSKITKADHAMFATESMEIDEAAIESELQAMEEESKPLPKARGAKGKQPRKVSAKQQAAARKLAEADAEAQRLAEEEASQQIASELEHSVSIQHSPPIVQPKRQRASSRQPSRQPPARSTRASVLSVNESNIQMTDDFHDAFDDPGNDSGNNTDTSMASQSTVVRGGSTRRGSTMKKGKGGKRIANRNIEEIVHKTKDTTSNGVPEEQTRPLDEVKRHITSPEESFYTPAPEVPEPVVDEPTTRAPKPKAIPKGKGRPPKAAPSSVSQEPSTETAPIPTEPTQPKSKTAKGKAVTRPRSPTPPPKEVTPVESPQSSDAENHPPSSKPAASAKKPATPHVTMTRIPLAARTPILSPSKRNVIAGLQSAHPWTAVDLDVVFLKSPSDENAPNGILGEAMQKVKNGDLTSPEKKMTVEEWIHHNAEMAEEKLRNECESMVGTFEREGGKAMQALEGVECVE